jgi:hypothetical protein
MSEQALNIVIPGENRMREQNPLDISKRFRG